MAKKKLNCSEEFHEVFSNEPKSVKKSGKTGKAREEMKIAIALSKCRRRK